VPTNERARPASIAAGADYAAHGVRIEKAVGLRATASFEPASTGSILNASDVQ